MIDDGDDAAVLMMMSCQSQESQLDPRTPTFILLETNMETHKDLGKCFHGAGFDFQDEVRGEETEFLHIYPPRPPE